MEQRYNTNNNLNYKINNNIIKKGLILIQKLCKVNSLKIKNYLFNIKKLISKIFN